MIEKAKQELSSYVALFNSVSYNYSGFNLYSCKVREEYYTKIMIKNISRGKIIGPEFSDIFTNELCNLLNILISKYNYGRFDLNISNFRQACNIDDFGNREIGTFALMLMFQYLSEYENDVLSINEDYVEIFKFILNCIDSKSFTKFMKI